MNISPLQEISRRCGVVLVIVGALAGSAFAAALTWDGAVGEATSKNPALVQAKETLAQARWALKSAYSGFLPQISADGSVAQSKSEDEALAKDYSYGISGSLSLFSGFSDTAGVKAKAYALHIAEADYARTFANTMYSLRKSFYDLLWTQETVQLLQGILQQRTENFEMIQLKYEAGSEDKGSLMRTDADRVQARYDLEKARRSLQTYSLALAQNMGRDDFSIIIVTGTMAPAAVATTLDLRPLIDGTPEHRIAYYGVGKAAADVTAARSGLFPTLTASAASSRSGAQWNSDTGGWSTALKLSFPLFTGGNTYYDIKTATSKKVAAAAALRQADQELAASITSAHNGLIDSTSNVTVQEKALTASETQARISTTKYINGLVSYQDWSTIQDDYISAQKSLLNARYNAVIAEAAYKKVLGTGAY